MTDLRDPRFSLRKQPKQARSTQLLQCILEAAIQVLTREGAQRFTCARVAETAGVSVGSLYQYFPNKEAILFRLQIDEWDQTGCKLRRVLGDRAISPHERLRTMIHEFFLSEYEEVAIRSALRGANSPGLRYLDAPEAQENRSSGRQAICLFMQETLPDLPADERAMVTDIILTATRSIGERVSTQGSGKADVERWANATGDMVCSYLESFGGRSPAVRPLPLPETRFTP